MYIVHCSVIPVISKASASPRDSDLCVYGLLYVMVLMGYHGVIFVEQLIIYSL